MPRSEAKFRTVIRLGLLDPPSMVPYSSIGGAGEPEPWTTEKHKRVALDMARESVVLLKNANGFLPLDKSAIKSIAVVGPRADEALIDLYGGQPPYAITPLEGIRAKVANRRDRELCGEQRWRRRREGRAVVGRGDSRGRKSSDM